MVVYSFSRSAAVSFLRRFVVGGDSCNKLTDPGKGDSPIFVRPRLRRGARKNWDSPLRSRLQMDGAVAAAAIQMEALGGFLEGVEQGGQPRRGEEGEVRGPF